MRVDSAFIANYAELRNNLINALGAFPEWWEVPHLPFATTIYVVVVLSHDDSATDLPPVDFEIALKRPGPGLLEQMLKVKSQRLPVAQDVEGAPVHQLIVVPVPINFGATGAHQIVVSVGYEAPVWIPFGLRIVPPGPPGVPLP